MERGEGAEDDYPNGFFSLPALNAGIDRLSQGFQDVFFDTFQLSRIKFES